MKKVLALAVICLVASTSYATSEVRVWLEIPTNLSTVTPGPTGYFSVQVWAEILGGTAGQGISDMAITIYSPDGNGIVEPRKTATGTSVVTQWGPTLGDVEMKIAASPAIPPTKNFNGYVAAVEASFGNGNYGTGTGEYAEDIGVGPTLLFTQTWKWLSGDPANLAVVVSDGARYWGADHASRVFFDNLANAGVDGGVVVPEPITMTMFGLAIGALGLKIRRRMHAA